jgi:hypothetical protein
MGKSRTGKKNPAYSTGWAMQGKRKYTGIHLRACVKYRKHFVEKHGYIFCEICLLNSASVPKTEVHHIYYASLWPKHKNLHDFRNLIMLCIQCHNNFHSGKYKDHFARLQEERGLKELFS